MRRSWPLFLALFCWLVVLAVPVTRRGTIRAWRQYTQQHEETRTYLGAGQFFAVSPRTAAAIRRYPNDRDVLIYAIANDTVVAKEVKKVSDLYPNDATILRLRLVREIKALRGWRPPGPLDSANWPKTPLRLDRPSVAERAQANEVIALARRGVKLEPNNTFFDWLLLYALYSTKRDDEARQVLSQAARKTSYNSHELDIALSTLNFLRRVDGSPIPPVDLIQLRISANSHSDAYSRLSRTSRMIMEAAIADRQKGAHDRSLKTALDLLKLSRVVRREGYSVNDSMVGSACARIALDGPFLASKDLVFIAPTGPGPGRGLAATAVQPSQRPRSLATYAQEVGRKGVPAFVDAEWAESTRWAGALGAFSRSGGGGYPAESLTTILLSERLRVMILRVLPSILLLGVIFWLLSRLFRDGLVAPVGLWRGVAFGALLLTVAMLCDAATTLSQQDYWYVDLGYRYTFGESLLQKAPGWIAWGLAGAMLCFGVHGAVVWQQQLRGRKTFKGQLKALFHPSEDGLAAFDFGWLFGWVARLTFWLILLLSIGALSYNMTPDNSEFIALTPVIFVVASLAAHAAAWRHNTHRRQALKLSHRLVAEAMGGFFVVASVLYAVTSFAILPTSFQFEREFEKALRMGDLKIARAKLKL